MTQMVNNMPAMWEAWVRSLGWEDPLEEGMATHSSILAWGIPMDSGGLQCKSCKESTIEQLSIAHRELRSTCCMAHTVLFLHFLNSSFPIDKSFLLFRVILVFLEKKKEREYTYKWKIPL